MSRPGYVDAALERMGIVTSRPDQGGGLPLAYHLELVDEADLMVDRVAQRLADAQRGKRPPNGFFREGQAARGPRFTVVEGAPRLNGRACCYAFVTETEATLGSVSLPWEGACPGCRTRYRIRLDVAVG